MRVTSPAIPSGSSIVTGKFHMTRESASGYDTASISERTKRLAM